MPRLFVAIEAPEETQACRAAGIDGVIAPAAMATAMQHAAAPMAIGWLVASVDGEALVLAVGGERSRLPVVAARPAEAALDAIRDAGGSGILLRSPGRLIDAMPVGEIAATIRAARARGLLAVVAGGIEPPDLPRLVALGPDAIVAGRALRFGADGTLDPQRLARMREMVPMGAATSPASLRAAAPDRIFVRDLVLEAEIGAYERERGRQQRVRFCVEAELTPSGGPARSMGDVVSYDLLVDAIHRLALGRHVDLVETLAEEIAASLLGIPRIAVVRVRIEKLDLPAGIAGVEIVRARA